MPTLKEYILTLRTYNPGITDKTITLYLLKQGKRMEDIQAAFVELVPPVAPNPVVAVEAIPEVVLQTQTQVQVQVQVPAQTPTPPTAISSNQTPQKSDVSHLDLEVMPAEVLASSAVVSKVQTYAAERRDIPKESPKEISDNQIHHQSFENLVRLQDMIKSLDENHSDSMSPKDGAIDNASVEPQEGLRLGSSLERKKFSYEEIFGNSSAQTSAQKPVSMEVPVVPFQVTKDPTVSYVGGSIVSGQGSGAFAFNASPVMSTKPVDMGVSVDQSPAIDTLTSVSRPDIKTVDTKVVINTVTPHPSARKKIVVSLLWLVILGGLIFGYMKYVHGVYTFVKPPYTTNNFVGDFAQSLYKIQNADYQLVAHLNSVAPSPQDEVFTISTSIKGISDIFTRALPVNTRLSLAVQGIYQKENGGQNNQFAIKGSYTGEGVSVDGDIETVKVGNMLYAQIHALPAFLFDISKIKDKWMTLTDSDIQLLRRRFGFPVELFTAGSISTDDAALARSQKQAVSIITHLKNTQVIQVEGDPVKKITSDRKVQYSYTVRFNKDRFVLFVKTLPEILRRDLGDDSIRDLDTQYITLLESPEVGAYLDFVFRNSKTIITVDSRGQLVSIEHMSSVATKELGGDAQKSVLGITLETKHVNSNIKVEKPQGVELTLTDVLAALTGQDSTEIAFIDQVKNIEIVDSSLQDYVLHSISLPTTLKDVPFLVASDYATYAYSNQSTSSYELIYDISLPKVPANYYDFLQFLTVSPSATGIKKYDTGIANNDPKPLLTLRFVEGKNTANAQVLSKEAFATFKNDSDKDGLSDSLEAYLGLNSRKNDTDGDGKSDLIEVRQGTNPKGDGDWQIGYGKDDSI